MVPRRVAHRKDRHGERRGDEAERRSSIVVACSNDCNIASRRVIRDTLERHEACGRAGAVLVTISIAAGQRDDGAQGRDEANDVAAHVSDDDVARSRNDGDCIRVGEGRARAHAVDGQLVAVACQRGDDSERCDEAEAVVVTVGDDNGTARGDDGESSNATTKPRLAPCAVQKPAHTPCQRRYDASEGNEPEPAGTRVSHDYCARGWDDGDTLRIAEACFCTCAIKRVAVDGVAAARKRRHDTREGHKSDALVVTVGHNNSVD